MAIPWRDPMTVAGPARRPRWSRRALVILGIAVLLTWVFAILAVLRLDSQRRRADEEAERVKAETKALIEQLKRIPVTSTP